MKWNLFPLNRSKFNFPILGAFKIVEPSFKEFSFWRLFIEVKIWIFKVSVFFWKWKFYPLSPKNHTLITWDCLFKDTGLAIETPCYDPFNSRSSLYSYYSIPSDGKGAELGTSQFCRDNVTMFSGNKVICCWLVAILLNLFLLHHLDLNIFRIFSGPWGLISLSRRQREAKKLSGAYLCIWVTMLSSLDSYLDPIHQLQYRAHTKITAFWKNASGIEAHFYTKFSRP